MVKKYCGQGLLEAVIAIGVLMTGLLAVISLVISNLTTQREAALRYQAANLAREGIELARNYRDSNWLAGKSAWDGLGNIGVGIDVAPEYAPGRRPLFNPVGDARVYRDPEGLFTQGFPESGAIPSPFSRVMTLRRFDCGGFDAAAPVCKIIPKEYRQDIGLEITSAVTWNLSGRTHNAEITETLYDWR